MKDVVQKEYKTSTETVNKFAESITTLKKSFKNLDDVLIKDDAKRKKALDDFIKRVKELLTEMKDAKESMDSFNSMLDKTSSYTSSPRNAVYQQPEPVQQTNLTPYAPATVNNDVNVNNNQGVSLTPDEIAAAMKKALQDLKLTPTSQYTGDNIIDALKSLSFDVD
jgi:ABC-type transporter Mla subunit MlaD